MQKFDDLIMQGISQDIQGSRLDKLSQLRATFEIEVGNWMGKSMEAILHWLQGLPSAVHIPWENYAIIEWIEANAQRKPGKPKTAIQCHNLVERYWINAATTLYKMLYN